MKQDLEVYKAVRDEALSGAGGMITVRSVFSILDALTQRFGDNFSIDAACKTLDTLASIAEQTKRELVAEQTQRKMKEGYTNK